MYAVTPQWWVCRALVFFFFLFDKNGKSPAVGLSGLNLAAFNMNVQLGLLQRLGIPTREPGQWQKHTQPAAHLHVRV